VRELVVAKQAREERHERDMVHAWHVAALTRMQGKDFPTLDKLLNKKVPTKRQTAVEQVAMWQLAATRFGGVFRPMDPSELTPVDRG
jgi:hypothetical protein